MKELSLQELKEIEFDILKVFDAFCKENRIKYYLAFGTLLGAIRYKKFIPWDDDIDVLVPREDYQRLLTLFQDDEKYRLYSFEKNENFHYPFAKLCDMTTRKEQTIYKNQGVELGVEIDIFPLDAWDDNFDKAKQEAKRIQKNMKWLKATKLDEPLTTNPVKRFAWKLLLPVVKTIGGAYFIKKIIKESNKEEQKGETKRRSYLGAKVWCIYGERGIIPAEVFEETVDIEFEGERFPAPSGWDTYLTCLYGDYLPEPPKEKQRTHHGFIAYRV